MKVRLSQFCGDLTAVKNVLKTVGDWELTGPWINRKNSKAIWLGGCYRKCSVIATPIYLIDWNIIEQNRTRSNASREGTWKGRRSYVKSIREWCKSILRRFDCRNVLTIVGDFGELTGPRLKDRNPKRFGLANAIESAVINNGFTTNWFKPSQGVYYKDFPYLSPYLSTYSMCFDLFEVFVCLCVLCHSFDRRVKIIKILFQKIPIGSQFPC